VTELARLDDVTIRQVLSGTITPVDYDQDHDEWAIVLAGGATLDVAGEEIELRALDWVLLPARTPHRLVRTDPGTSWLTVHTRALDGGGSGRRDLRQARARHVDADLLNTGSHQLP
jgi:cupin 2 domain-containing protein